MTARPAGTVNLSTRTQRSRHTSRPNRLRAERSHARDRQQGQAHVTDERAHAVVERHVAARPLAGTDRSFGPRQRKPWERTGGIVPPAEPAHARSRGAGRRAAPRGRQVLAGRGAASVRQCAAAGSPRAAAPAARLQDRASRRRAAARAWSPSATARRPAATATDRAADGRVIGGVGRAPRRRVLVPVRATSASRRAYQSRMRRRRADARAPGPDRRGPRTRTPRSPRAPGAAAMGAVPIAAPALWSSRCAGGRGRCW